MRCATSRGRLHEKAHDVFSDMSDISEGSKMDKPILSKDKLALDRDLVLRIHKYRRQSFTSPAVKLLTGDESDQLQISGKSGCFNHSSQCSTQSAEISEFRLCSTLFKMCFTH